MTIRLYEFGSAAAGLQFTITANTDIAGHTEFTVNVLTGSLNLNAVYWSDGDKVNDVISNTDLIGFTGKSSENSLNMNGSGEVWDGGIKLSDTGLGKVPPATYLHAGDSYHFAADIDLSLYGTLGVRATSTSTADGSIKWIDNTPTTVDTHHAGDLIAKWDFEDTTATYNSGQAVSAPNGWFNVSDYAEQNNLGVYAKSMEVVKDDGSHLISGYGAGETQWLDTAASPGNIWIQLSEANRTTNIQHDAELTVSVAKQMFGDGSGGSNGGANSHTDPNASVDFYFNYELIGTVKASDLTTDNEFQDFHFIVHANDSMATDQIFIQSHGTDTTAQGLAIDHIELHDWII
jgi:hypothetical protein